ncbi:MAG: hypothetical protein HYT80_05330 [Euryarchaeota archaeon]|nr:hypothetical protein [Euryarchaeota archaeon]
MDRPLAWVILASLAGLAAMAGASAVVHPPRVALSDLAGHVGATVTTTARILELETHEGGWTRLVLGDGNHSVEATSAGPPDAVPGDVADVIGLVVRAGPRLRLQVDHADDVTVRVPWQDQHEPLRRILDRPWELREARVVTSGELRRTGPNAFVEDDGQRLRAVGEGLEGWEPGTLLRVEGLVEYDEDSGSFRLRVDHARHA